MLDRQLSQHGEDIVVRRYTAPTGEPRPKTDLTVRAFVRAVKAEEMIGTITQTASTVVIGPAGLSALWPLRKNDKTVIAGRERNVEAVKPILLANVLVRVDLVVAG
jgi:hypothetical protein